MELLVLGLVATIGFASYALWSKARADEAPAAPPPELEAPDRTTATLQLGDVVQHLGTDYVIEGMITLAEDGRGARLYRLADGGAERFLFASATDPDPTLLEAADVGAFEGGGAPESLEHAGTSYRLKLRTSSTALRTGVVGAGTAKGKSGDRVSLAEYASGAQRLLVLHWSDHFDAFLGERVPLHLFEFLPGK